ncbi:RagB/SusD family nutrient uptake outer membrane protein [Alistipes sp.]|uniref:RagB/SusD family nutrient uptake outer membrane protein n=1 Tax=Alistipes sp. TaxID=1872444 RepID=UPI003AF06896
MKRSILLLLVASACAACLDTQPEDFTSPSTWYRNEKELEAALATVYDPLRDVYGLYLSVEFSQGSDECFSKESTPKLVPYYYNYDTGNASVKVVWQELYKGIDCANVLLENAGKAACAPELLRQVEGEALFLRAYYHFLLTAYWGDVPLRLESTKSAADVHRPRVASQTIYETAIGDMEDALEMVADIRTLGFGGRVSKQAVKGILARVCLHAAGRLGRPEYYAEARKWAWSLMEEGVHGLEPDFRELFIRLMQDRYDIRESIFEVECYGNVESAEMKETGQFAAYYTPMYTKQDYCADEQTRLSIARGRGVFYCTPQLYDSYEEGDLRRDWTIMPYMYRNDAVVERIPYNEPFRFRWPGKFRREYEINLPVYSWGNSTNYPLLRYADVLLLFAEADNEVNNGSTPESLEAVNQVRRRAFGFDPLTPLAEVDLGAMLHDEMLAYLQAERARELAFESHRRLDLLRWGIFLERMHRIGEELAAIPLKVTVDGKPVDNPVFTQSGSGFPMNSNPTGPEMMARPFRNVADKHCLMPIPELEMSVNKAITENNPGWN